MPASTAQALQISVLFPKRFDEELFRGLLADCGRAIDIKTIEYNEGFRLRTRKSDRAPREELAAASPPVTDDVRDALAEAEILQVLDVPLDLLNLAPRLRWVQSIGAGVWHLYPSELAKAGVVLTNASGVAATAIAEFFYARLLELWKGLAEIRADQSRRRWAPREGRSLVGKTLGVVGAGAIGSEILRLGRCLGMNVLGIRRQGGRLDQEGEAAWGPDRLGDLLRQADVVVLTVPENHETHHMIGAAELALMRPDAVLCNVSRGSVVDEPALIAALREGRLGAAILDVMENEPLDVESPLWTVPNMHLSPHVAALSDGYGPSLTGLFAENTRRYLRGDPLHNTVDAERGY